jgi:hypothetical protein
MALGSPPNVAPPPKGELNVPRHPLESCITLRISAKGTKDYPNFATIRAGALITVVYIDLPSSSDLRMRADFLNGLDNSSLVTPNFLDQ